MIPYQCAGFKCLVLSSWVNRGSSRQFDWRRDSDPRKDWRHKGTLAQAPPSVPPLAVGWVVKWRTCQSKWHWLMRQRRSASLNVMRTDSGGQERWAGRAEIMSKIKAARQAYRQLASLCLRLQSAVEFIGLLIAVNSTKGLLLAVNSTKRAVNSC